MKKALFQLFLLVIPFAGLQAQLQIGLTGSVNGRVIMRQNNYGFSKLAYKPVTGIGYGVFVGYRFGENSKHSVNLEISSMALGQAYEEEISKNNISNLYYKNIDLEYWQIPLVLNLGINNAANGNVIYIAVGGYYGSLSSANIDWKIDGNEVTLVTFHESQNRNPNIDQIKAKLGSSEDPADYKELFNKADFGAILGIGAKWKLSGQLGLITELRGGYGLADINAEDWQLPRTDETYKKSTNAFGGIRIGLSYSFGNSGE